MQLEVHELEVRYGRVHAVRGVSATLDRGEPPIHSRVLLAGTIGDRTQGP